MDRAAELLNLAQTLADERPSLFLTKGPGIGDHDTGCFVRDLRRRAIAAFKTDFAERTISGASGLRVDYYFPEEATIVELAFLLKNSPSEFEKDILKAVMAKENGEAVSRLVFLAKPGAVRRCLAPDRRSIIEWVLRSHGIRIQIEEISPQNQGSSPL